MCARLGEATVTGRTLNENKKDAEKHKQRCRLEAWQMRQDDTKSQVPRLCVAKERTAHKRANDTGWRATGDEVVSKWRAEVLDWMSRFVAAWANSSAVREHSLGDEV